jgi:hypothetical protein
MATTKTALTHSSKYQPGLKNTAKKTTHLTLQNTRSSTGQKNYAGVEGSKVGSTPFADGWYVPSSNEMLKLKDAMQTVDEARTLCGGDSLRQEIFFTSSTQRAEEWDYVVIFGKDGIYAPPKWTGGGNSQTVCAIREFD